ncbi:MAG: type IX secretion system membrane protein PorP/SprF [Cytophagales bacterium]
MNKLLTFLFLLFFFGVNAQIDPQFSYYNFNTQFNNPATSGIDNKLNFLFIHRSQWLGYQPTVGSGISPTTQLVSFSSPVNPLKGGLGFFLTNDALANVLRNNNFMLSYSYHLKVGKGTKIGLGVRGGVFNSRIDGSQYRFNDVGDPNINLGVENAVSPDLGGGISLFNPKYSFGVSATHLNSPRLMFGNASGTTLPMLFVIHGAYNFSLGDKFSLNPNFIVKSTQKTNSLSIDIGAIIEYDSRFWFGSSFRTFESVGFLAGINVLRDNNLKIGYGFDYVVSNASAKAPSSHEIMLLYSIEPLLSAIKPPVRSPRFRF